MSTSLPTMKSFDNFKSAVGRLSLTLNPVSSNLFMKHIKLLDHIISVCPSRVPCNVFFIQFNLISN